MCTLRDNCPIEVIVLPCLTSSSYLKDQQVWVAQILVKWHLLVSAYNERHVFHYHEIISGGTRVGRYSLVLPILEEIDVPLGVIGAFSFRETEPLQLLLFFYCKSVEHRC